MRDIPGHQRSRQTAAIDWPGPAPRQPRAPATPELLHAQGLHNPARSREAGNTPPAAEAGNMPRGDSLPEAGNTPAARNRRRGVIDRRRVIDGWGRIDERRSDEDATAPAATAAAPPAAVPAATAGPPATAVPAPTTTMPPATATTTATTTRRHRHRRRATARQPGRPPPAAMPGHQPGPRYELSNQGLHAWRHTPLDQTDIWVANTATLCRGGCER